MPVEQQMIFFAVLFGFLVGCATYEGLRRMILHRQCICGYRCLRWHTLTHHIEVKHVHKHRGEKK